MNILSEDQTIRELDERWGIDRSMARRVVQIAREHGVKAEPVTDGYITVTRVNNNSYVIERGNKERAETRSQVAVRTAEPYTRPARKSRPARQPAPARTHIPSKGRTKTMAKGATATAEVEETEENVEKDYTSYADKSPTSTMADFAEWLETEVFGGEYPGDRDAFLDGVRLGGTLRMEFQRSEFNVNRREERRLEREQAAAAEPEEAEEAPAPKRAARGRAAAKPAAAAKATTAKPAAPRRRGKPAASAEAPY